MKRKLLATLILIVLLVGSSGTASAQEGKPPSNPDAVSSKNEFVQPMDAGQRQEVTFPSSGQEQQLVTVPILVNSSFEQGRLVGWSEFSSQSVPIVFSSGNLPITPKSGSWAAWLAGLHNETSILSQGGINIINPTHLRLWYWIDSSDICGYDYGYVKINGLTIHTWNLCTSTNTNGWLPLDLDLSAYNGSTVTLSIQSDTDSSLISDLFIDSLSLYSTFADVPYDHYFWSQIEAFYDAGLTVGCVAASPKLYCPYDNVTRAEMATFIERALGNFSPTPSPTGMFADVPYPGLEHLTPFIEEFYNDGLTTGCGTSPLRYCPANKVTRAEMATFIERALGNFSPTPSLTGMFVDVPYPGLEHLTPFIEEFYNDGITTGCAVSPLRFCPANNVTRQEMAVFIVRAFGIPLP